MFLIENQELRYDYKILIPEYCIRKKVQSSRVKPLQGKIDNEENLEAVMYVPVYRKGFPIGNLEEPRKAIYRWVYSPYQLKDLFLGIVTDSSSTTVSNSTEAQKDNPQVLKILLADDSDFKRFLIKEYLRDGIHKIIEAENGEIAVDKVKQEEFDDILMDIQMPVMDGYTAVKEIRDWEKKVNRRHIPTVAITAYTLKEEEDKSFAVGFDQHLSKPIMKDSLLQVLEIVTLS